MCVFIVQYALVMSRRCNSLFFCNILFVSDKAALFKNVFFGSSNVSMF